METPQFKPDSIRVLVVDEHGLIRKSIGKVLDFMGITEIEESHSGREASSIVQTVDFDLIIMNLYYTDYDGHGIIEQIRNRDSLSDSPILVLSGQTDKEDIVKAIDKGATEYMLLPFKSEDLKKKLLAMLNHYFSPNKTVKALRKIETLISSRDFDQALQAISTFVKAGKKLPALGYLRAVIEKERDDLNLAIDILEEQIELYPDFLKNYKLLTDLYLKQGKHQLGIESFEKELQLNPKNVFRQIRLANLLVRTKRYKEAKEHFRQALLEDSKNGEALFGMAIAYFKDGNLEKSIYYLKRHRRGFPKDSKSLEAIVKFCRFSQQDRLAELALKDEKKNHPDRLDTYIILARFLLQDERPEDGIKVLKKGIEIHKEEFTLYHCWAQIVASQGVPDEVDAIFTSYRNQTSDLASYLPQAKLFLKYNFYSRAVDTVHTALIKKIRHPIFLDILNSSFQEQEELGCAYMVQRKILSNKSDKNTISPLTLKKTVKKIKMRRSIERAKIPDAS